MKTRTIQIEYGGVIWTRYPDSKRRTHRVYYQRHEKWKEPPVFLHRRIYEDNYGPIPDGYHVHHKDGDTENNSPENLEALSPEEHGKVTVQEFLSDEERKKKAFSYRKSLEYRRKASVSQKNRRKIESTCELCGEKFLTRCHAKIRWCPECKKMWYSDKNGQHFSKKKQLERFGEIRIPYDSKL